MTGLVAEISHRYRPDRIELESPDFMGFAHGYHHEKDGLGLLPEETFLLGVCFCDHCLARADGGGRPGRGRRGRPWPRSSTPPSRANCPGQVPGFPERAHRRLRAIGPTSTPSSSGGRSP